MTKITVVGDSQTDYRAGYSVRPSDTWAGQLSRLRGGPVRAFGISGNTSQDVINRAGVYFQYDTPDVAGIAIGVNDPTASISQAQTQTNLQVLLMMLRHGAAGTKAQVATTGIAAGQANLPQVGRLGDRWVVTADTSTTGGMPAWHGQHAATITGTVSADSNGAQIAVWEYRYPRAGELGWGRVAVAATAPTAVKRIFVVPPPYWNFVSGGDTPATPLARNVAIRAALQAAATAVNTSDNGEPSVIYVDLYTFMKNRIVAGTDPDFSTVAFDATKSWHRLTGDQHYSDYGQMLQAQKIAADMVASWPSIA